MCRNADLSSSTISQPSPIRRQGFLPEPLAGGVRIEVAHGLTSVSLSWKKQAEKNNHKHTMGEWYTRVSLRPLVLDQNIYCAI